MTSATDYLGSVSSGTMRPEDLIPVFSDLLADLAQSDKHRALVKEAEAIEDFGSDDADYILSDLFDALGEYAPDYCYFGAHSGDGADYGYWICWDSIEADVHDGALVKIEAGEERPKNVAVLEVNDHGNATLYGADGSQIWSVV